jgi:hypothetical protein
LELFRSERSSGSDVTDGVETRTGDDDEVSDSFCWLGVDKRGVSLACWSFMDQDIARIFDRGGTVSHIAMES